MPQYVYKTCLVLLVLTLSSFSIELSFITSILVTLLCLTKKVNNNLFIATLMILTVTIIGLLSTQWLKHSIYDLLKDIVYFSRPIAVILASYFVVKRIESLNFIFNVVVIIASVYALKHILIILINIGSIDSYVYIRSLGGKHNHIELIALVFLLFTPYTTILPQFHKIFKFLLSISIILYFSRTMFVVLFIFYLGYKGYLLLNRKFLKGIFVFGLVSVLLGITISNIKTNRDSQGLKKFIYKTQNSFKELFEPFDTDKIKNDRRALWEHWRAYEAKKAIQQLDENGIKAWLIGMGFGSQIDLETYVYLEGEKFYEVPSIHNGFVYVLFKTGIIGLTFYLLFILSIFLKHQRFKVEKEVFDNMIVASCLYLLFTSFVIAGFYRAGEFSMFLFGALIASKFKLKTIYQID